MSLKHEQYNSLIYTRDFLYDLLDTKKSVIVTDLTTGEETFFEYAKQAQEKYKVSIPSLMRKKKNIGIRKNLHFKYVN